LEGLNGDRRKLSIWYRPRIPRFFRIAPRRNADRGLKFPVQFIAAAKPPKNDSHLKSADKGPTVYFLQNSAHVPDQEAVKEEQRSGRSQRAMLESDCLKSLREFEVAFGG
jgi:hypothetical protein